LGPDTVIDGRFVLQGEERRGGIGSVWKARDVTSGEAVAVKVLHATSPEQAHRFLREAALLADLDHPSIVGYVAHGTLDGDRPYLAMEWLDGESVSERLARRPLTLHESLTLARGAAPSAGLATVERRADKIADPALRTRFVAEVPEHRALRELASG
jgi:serine/threonine protein kinase